MEGSGQARVQDAASVHGYTGTPVNYKQSVRLSHRGNGTSPAVSCSSPAAPNMLNFLTAALSSGASSAAAAAHRAPRARRPAAAGGRTIAAKRSVPSRYT